MGFRLRVASLFCLAGLAGGAWGAEYSIDGRVSLFAVVTHKAGPAARFAHNHLVYPSTYDVALSMEPTDVTTARFTLKFPAADLTVDGAGTQQAWYPKIHEAGILDTPFKAIDEKDRHTVLEHMLGEDQLDAKQYADISATLVSVRAEASERGEAKYTHMAKISFTAHGKTVERECAATIVATGDAVTVDAVGEFKFTEFGITPYSAMAGAVKNRDEFHVFVHLEAKVAPAPQQP